MQLIIRHGVNPIYEALAYLTLRVNGRSVAERAQELSAIYPEKTEIIQNLAAPAVKIEAELNARIDVSDPVFEKYFRCYDWPNRYPVYFGNLASTYLWGILHDDPTIGVDALEARALSLSDEDRVLSLSLPHNDGRGCFVDGSGGFTGFCGYLDELSIPSDRKWECAMGFLHFDDNVRELMLIICSVVEAFLEITKDMEPPSFGLEDDSDDALLAESAKYSNVEFDMEHDIALVGSYMLFDGRTYMVLKHVPTTERNEDWTQTTMYLGFARFDMKEIENESLSGESLAEALRTIADPTRLEILRILSTRSVYAKELCEQLNMSPSAISKHIAKLVSAGLIDCRVDSVRTYYSLDEEKVTELMNATTGMILGK